MFGSQTYVPILDLSAYGFLVGGIFKYHDDGRVRINLLDDLKKSHGPVAWMPVRDDGLICDIRGAGGRDVDEKNRDIEARILKMMRHGNTDASIEVLSKRFNSAQIQNYRDVLGSRAGFIWFRKMPKFHKSEEARKYTRKEFRDCNIVCVDTERGKAIKILSKTRGCYVPGSESDGGLANKDSPANQPSGRKSGPQRRSSYVSTPPDPFDRVYLARCYKLGLAKFGVSNDHDRRCRDLNHSLPSTLTDVQWKIDRVRGGISNAQALQLEQLALKMVEDQRDTLGRSGLIEKEYFHLDAIDGGGKKAEDRLDEIWHVIESFI